MNYQPWYLRAERRQPWAHRHVPFAEAAPATRPGLVLGAIAAFFALCLLATVLR